MSKKITTQSQFNINDPSVQQHLSGLNSSWKMRLYLLIKLPSTFFWGVKIKSCTPYKSEVTLPYSWRTQNPYQSIYFAAQSGAAELSTGILATTAIKGRGKISMLITNFEAQFIKKANTKTTFTCEDGSKILAAVQKAIDTNEGQKVTITSKGVQKTGEVVSQFKITWSFKKKN